MTPDQTSLIELENHLMEQETTRKINEEARIENERTRNRTLAEYVKTNQETVAAAVEEKTKGIEDRVMAVVDEELEQLDGLVTAQDEKIQGNAERIDANAEQIIALGNTVAEAATSVEALASTVSGNKAELDGKVAATEAKADGAKSASEANATAIRTLTDTVTANKAEADATKETAGNALLKASANEAAIGENEAKIDELMSAAGIPTSNVHQVKRVHINMVRPNNRPDYLGSVDVLYDMGLIVFGMGGAGTDGSVKEIGLPIRATSVLNEIFQFYVDESGSWHQSSFLSPKDGSPNVLTGTYPAPPSDNFKTHMPPAFIEDPYKYNLGHETKRAALVYDEANSDLAEYLIKIDNLFAYVEAEAGTASNGILHVELSSSYAGADDGAGLHYTDVRKICLKPEDAAAMKFYPSPEIFPSVPGYDNMAVYSGTYLTEEDGGRFYIYPSVLPSTREEYEIAFEIPVMVDMY